MAAAIDVGRERLSCRDGSVVDREKVGVEVTGGVPVREGRVLRTPVGSVVRRDDGGGAGGGAPGDVTGEDVSGAATTATELVGLAVVADTPNAALRGELEFDDV